MDFFFQVGHFLIQVVCMVFNYGLLLFNAVQMYEGSSLYASAIANKLIEALDRQYAAIPPTSSY